MSMISSQIDELRRTAQTYRNFGKYEAEQMMLDAADTIWRLRDDLQRANAENAKLREQLEYDRQTSRSRLERIDQLKDENARLRELVRDMWELGFGDNSGANNAWAWHEEADALEDRMRELGIGIGVEE